MTRIFFFSSRRRHTRYIGDWSSDVCSSDLTLGYSKYECHKEGIVRRRGTTKLIGCQKNKKYLATRIQLDSGETPEVYIDWIIAMIFLGPLPKIGRASCRERV